MSTLDTKALRAMREKATPMSNLVKLERYAHGGGRLHQDGPAGERALIADFYDEGDREYIYALLRAAPLLLDAADERDALRARVAELEREVERVREAAREGLYRMMHDYSEERWCAGWYNGLENEIVRLAGHGDGDAQDIIDTAKAVGGIWTWRDSDTDCTFRTAGELDGALRAALTPSAPAKGGGGSQ